MSAFQEGFEGVVRTAALILWTRATMVEAGMRQVGRWGGTAQFSFLHGEIRGYTRLASARFIPSPKDLFEICAVGFRGIELAWRRLITASDVVAQSAPATIGLSVACSHSLRSRIPPSGFQLVCTGLYCLSHRPLAQHSACSSWFVRQADDSAKGPLLLSRSQLTFSYQRMETPGISF